MDARTRLSNMVWMAALACLLVLSLADVLFFSKLASGGEAEAQSASASAGGDADVADGAATGGAADGSSDATGGSKAGAAGASASKSDGIDYLVLVNKTHELDEDWENKVTLVEATNQRGSTIVVEKQALAAFEELQEELQSEGVVIDLNSCYRSRAKQQELVDQFTQEYGSDYVEKYVAKAGHSEHETGLALDVIPIVNGVEMLTNDEMLAQTELWETVHTTMPKYGFILRYLPNQESITGYEYEPWHLRYVGTPDAEKITKSGLTLEEYLGEA